MLKKPVLKRLLTLAFITIFSSVSFGQKWVELMQNGTNIEEAKKEFDPFDTAFEDFDEFNEYEY